MGDCPKCRGRMTQGFLYQPDSGMRVKWVDGEPGGWKSLFLGIQGKTTDLTSRRCVACGYVEFFADTSSKPVNTIATLEDENEQLRRLVTRLHDRLSTLEAIVVDPGERAAREIEALRLSPTERGEESGRLP